MRHSVLIYFFLFFLCVSLVGGSVLTTYTQFVEDGPLEEAKDIMIPKGKSLKNIARLLKKEGIIDSAAIFELGVRASGNTLKVKSGEYHFPRHASAKLVMNILTDGQTVARRFVVPEGLSSYQIVELMDHYKGLTGEVSKIPPNGTLLPETYNYSFGDSKESLIRRMQDAMDKTVAELWAKRSKKISLKNPQEAIIMASIIEKETGKVEERAHIASVFYNRLRKKIRLQSCPTVIYAITEGKYNFKRNLTYKDLKIKSPYNTYLNYGLPVGPISNPGRASIEAVLNPMETKDFYFVANGRGGHIFSENYKDHQKGAQQLHQSQKNKAKKVAETEKKSSETLPELPPDTTGNISPDVLDTLIEKSP